MSIQIAGGTSSNHVPYLSPVVLYDDTDGMAFGPTFDDRREAGAFVRWFEARRKVSGWEGPLVEVKMLRNYSYIKAKEVADEWRKLVENHLPYQCPWDDRESYGVGFTGDSDSTNWAGTEARPVKCNCECHNREGVI